MSRIGRKPIDVPAGVQVTIDGSHVAVKGPKGELARTLHSEMQIGMEGNVITVTRPSDNKQHRSLHGLTRTLVFNMIEGVTNGYTKTLEIAGVGFRAAKQGNKIVLNLGFSHPVEIVPPQGLTVDVPAPTKLVVSGADKEAVGALAAKIRSYKEPEPYKGKGIKYEGEHIVRKVGKTGGKGKK